MQVPNNPVEYMEKKVPNHQPVVLWVPPFNGWENLEENLSDNPPAELLQDAVESIAMDLAHRRAKCLRSYEAIGMQPVQRPNRG